MVNLTKNGLIVRFEEPIALFGGGYIGSEDTELVLSRVKRVAAADGGAVALIDSGHVPEIVIGDLDSFPAEYRFRLPAGALIEIDEQDSTDFDKALRNIEAPLIIGVGFLGARVDHQLAAFNALVRFQDRPCILLGEHEVIFHAPPQIAIPLEAGETVSLFPMRRVTGRSTGLEWPIEGLEFIPDGRIGTSNRALSGIELHMDGPGLLVMVPRAALDHVMQAFLSDRTGRWPARAE